MAAPTLYSLSYDFTSFQTSNPTTPLPADKIEIEFNNLETTTDEIITNLGLIQRSDGALANGIVTVDSLSTDVSLILGLSSADLANVTIVAADLDGDDDIGTVADDITAVGTCASNIAAIATAFTNASNASDSASYAEEWANKAEDDLISGAAGGDGVDDYSAKHFAAKAQAAVNGVRVSSNDSTPDDLEAKLVAGAGISMTTQNDGGNETRTIAANGGSHEFVASGNLPDGTPVVLKSDGTVEVAEISVDGTLTAGTAVQFETGVTAFTSIAYDTAHDKIVIAYEDDDNSDYGTAVVGTVSGNSITFGSPVVFESAAISYPVCAYDANTERVVIAYTDEGNSSYGTAIVGEVSNSSNSISFNGTAVVFESASSSYMSIVFNDDAKVVVSYTDAGNGDHTTSIVGTVTGASNDSISFGTPVDVDTTYGFDTAMVWDSVHDRLVLIYIDNENSNSGTAVVGEVDSANDTISFGTPVVFSGTNDIDNPSICFDPDTEQIVIAYEDGGSVHYGTAIVGEVDPSNNSISFGTKVVFESANVSYTACAYDESTNRVVIAFSDNLNTDHGTAVIGEVSGNSIIFGSAAVFRANNTDFIEAVYDPDQQRVVVSCSEATVNGGEAIVLQVDQSTNADDWIGITEEAINDTETGRVTILGGVNESVSGLSVGSIYYLADDGTLTTNTSSGRKLGKAIATDKILITEPNT